VEFSENIVLIQDRNPKLGNCLEQPTRRLSADRESLEPERLNFPPECRRLVLRRVMPCESNELARMLLADFRDLLISCLVADARQNRALDASICRSVISTAASEA
jgi:hypothetical protein